MYWYFVFIVDNECFIMLEALRNDLFGNKFVECQFWFMGPMQCFKSYLSNKFDWPETICDRGKINLAGHGVHRLPGNYFDQVLYSVFNM